MLAMSGFFEVVLIFQTVSEVKALGAFAFVHFPQCMLLKFPTPNKEGEK